MSQCQQLRGAGPARSEVTTRHTLCSVSRSPIVAPMLDFATSSAVTGALPGTVPRDIITVFEFRSSTKRRNAELVPLEQDAPLLPAVIAEVFK